MEKKRDIPCNSSLATTVSSPKQKLFEYLTCTYINRNQNGAWKTSKQMVRPISCVSSSLEWHALGFSFHISLAENFRRPQKLLPPIQRSISSVTRIWLNDSIIRLALLLTYQFRLFRVHPHNSIFVAYRQQVTDAFILYGELVITFKILPSLRLSSLPYTTYKP